VFLDLLGKFEPPSADRNARDHCSGLLRQRVAENIAHLRDSLGT
jgi:hypothetical protein